MPLKGTYLPPCDHLGGPLMLLDRGAKFPLDAPPNFPPRRVDNAPALSPFLIIKLTSPLRLAATPNAQNSLCRGTSYQNPRPAHNRRQDELRYRGAWGGEPSQPPGALQDVGGCHIHGQQPETGRRQAACCMGDAPGIFPLLTGMSCSP